MRNQKLQSVMVLTLSFITAMMLSILPLPHWAIWFRPAWVAMVLLYWVLALPNRVGQGVAFLLGLLLDGLYGSVLGEHALALVLITFIMQKSYLQFRVYPLFQQGICMLGLVFIYQSLIVIIQGVLGQASHSGLFWLPAVTSMLLWPWIAVILSDIEKRFSV